MEKLTIDDIIKKYPRIFQDYEGNPHRVNWYDVPDGWLPVIDTLCGSIQSYIDNTWRYVTGGEKVSPPQVTCTQMKEKFGGLRFYVNNSDEQIEGMIRMAEFMCEHICQKCGSKENIGQTQGWVTTLCGTCGSDVISWKPYKQESNGA